MKKINPPAAIPCTRSNRVTIIIADLSDTNPQQVDFAVSLLLYANPL